jgi:hypothetical protein
VGEKIFTAPSQGDEEQEEETEDVVTFVSIANFFKASLAVFVFMNLTACQNSGLTNEAARLISGYSNLNKGSSLPVVKERHRQRHQTQSMILM